MLVTGPTFNTASINEQSIPTFLAGGTVTILPSRGWTPERTSELIDRWRLHPRRRLPGHDGAVPGRRRRRSRSASSRCGSSYSEGRTARPRRLPGSGGAGTTCRSGGLRVDRGGRDHLDPRRGARRPPRLGRPRSFGAQTFRVVDPRAAPVPRRRDRRGRHRRAVDHQRLLERARPDSGDDAGRLVWTGDLGPGGRGRLPLHRGPLEGHDHLGRPEHVPGGDRERPVRAHRASSRRRSSACPTGVGRGGVRASWWPSQASRSARRTSSTSSRSVWPRTRSRATSCSWTGCPATHGQGAEAGSPRQFVLEAAREAKQGSASSTTERRLPQVGSADQRGRRAPGRGSDRGRRRRAGRGAVGQRARERALLVDEGSFQELGQLATTPSRDGGDGPAPPRSKSVRPRQARWPARSRSAPEDFTVQGGGAGIHLSRFKSGVRRLPRGARLRHEESAARAAAPRRRRQRGEVQGGGRARDPTLVSTMPSFPLFELLDRVAGRRRV